MKRQQNIVEKIEALDKHINNISDSFSKNCNLRSYEFALAVASDDREKGLQLTERLMKDENFRKFNSA